MDHSGDTRYNFNTGDAKAVVEAEARFKELTGASFTATTFGEPMAICSFDPTAEETLFFPRLVGG